MIGTLGMSAIENSVSSKFATSPKQVTCGSCSSLQPSSDLELNEESGSQVSNISGESCLERTNFGGWGKHSLEKQPWNDANKPFVKCLDYGKLKLQVNESKGVLTDRVISSCSSYVDRSPVNGCYVVCKCSLSNKGLRNINILNHHHYLQHLDLSNNDLTQLEPLGQLPFLMYLDVSKNNLSEVLDFIPPFYLTYVKYSYNQIEKLKDLSGFWSVVYLDLSHNSIKIIEGVGNLKYLRQLNLSYNAIECLENLDNLNIQDLYLSNNNIYKFETSSHLGLKTLNHLITADLSYNNLTSLKLFNGVHSLQEVNMTANSIACLMELNYFRNLTELSKVELHKNPIASISEYYRVCLDCVQNITFLDGQYISATDKVKIRLQFEEYTEFRSHVAHGRMLAIEQLQEPFIGCQVVTVEQPPPPIIVLCGALGSGKGELVQEFCRRHSKYAVLGVNHTTRPKNTVEVDHEAYHFVSIDTFRDMLKQGEFLTIFEVLGHCYGFAESELQKVTNTEKVLVTHMSLDGALILRSRGLSPSLVLAMPSEIETHKYKLKNKYYPVFWGLDCNDAITVANWPSKAKTFREQEARIEKMFASHMCREMINEMIAELPREQPSKNLEVKEMKGSFGILKSASTKKLAGQSTLSVTFEEISGAETLKNDSISKMIGTHIGERCSVSETSVKQTAQSVSVTFLECAEELENPFLSVLSKTDLDTNLPSYSCEKTSELALQMDEAKIQSILLEVFYKKVLEYRENYFKIHIQNPGLFRDVILTDDFESCMHRLKNILCKCVTIGARLPPVLQFKHNDLVYTNMICGRMQFLNSELYK